MKTSTNFGMMVELVFGVWSQVMPFLQFLIFNIIGFTIIFSLIGLSFGDTDDIFQFVNLFVQTFRTSIGDLQDPEFDFWNKQIGNDQNLVVSYLNIYWGWFLWYVQLLFIFIILLNFFIALIGNAYDECMSTSEVKNYSHKATVNREAFAFFQFLGKLQAFDFYIL